MSAPNNPSEIARETLRLLATRRIAPTPENYLQHYQEIAGQPAAAPESSERRSTAAPVWAQLILDVIKQWETRHSGLTSARKREGLERLLGAPGSDSASLAAKLRKLVDSWSATTTASAQEVSLDPAAPSAAHDQAAAARRGAALPDALAADAAEALTQLRELLAQTLEFAVISQLGHAPDLADEATGLAQVARTATGKEFEQFARALKQFWFKLEVRGGDNAEFHQGLLRLLQLLISNTHELLSDDQWLRGQVAILQEIVTRPLDLANIAEAERRIKELIFKQGTLRSSLQEAKIALKQLIGGFIDRLGDLSESTDGYQSRLEAYAHKIRQTDDIRQLNVVLEDLLQDTRSAQRNTAHTHDELLGLRRKVEAAERKVQDLEHELEQVSGLAQEDPLTGALNRRGLDDAYHREATRAERAATPLCVALLDVDNFRQLNDEHGHQTGDEALRHLVRVIRRTLRPSDVLVRYGGEEFLLLLCGSELAEAIEVMTRLQRSLTKAFFLHDNERLFITFSAGVARRADGESQATVIARADQALYEAKHSGKNRVCGA